MQAAVDAGSHASSLIHVKIRGQPVHGIRVIPILCSAYCPDGSNSCGINSDLMRVKFFTQQQYPAQIEAIHRDDLQHKHLESRARADNQQ